MNAVRSLGRQVWERRQSPVVGATALALIFVVAWTVKDLVDGTSVLHAVVAGILTGVAAGILYWIALRAMQAVGEKSSE